MIKSAVRQKTKQTQISLTHWSIVCMGQILDNIFKHISVINAMNIPYQIALG